MQKTGKHSKLTVSLAACTFAFFVACASPSSLAYGAESNTFVKCEKSWKVKTVEHRGFKDLGHYVIELPDYTDASVEKKGLAAMNATWNRGDIAKGGCTAMVRLNSKGEVIFGRNTDLEISQRPAYVYKTTYGKYKNVSVSYLPTGYLPYKDIQKLDTLDEEWQSMLIYLASDCLNEKGLYIEMNLREKNDKLSCYGLHSARGEKKRNDGTPWSELRACTLAIPQLVSQNCATVKEALAYLKNSFDWYTINVPGSHNDGQNMCFLIGDATGEFGLIEFAQDEINYIPYQYGQANFYITPKWHRYDTCGAGDSRLHKVSEVIGGVDTLDEAMDAMKPMMWRNETLWISESERAKDKAHPNPYNQIIFKDNKGNPQLDWRNEYVAKWPVLDDGRLITTAKMYEDAKKSTYNPKIKKYFDDALARGTLVIDDGSIKFNVNGDKVTLTELQENFALFEKNPADPKVKPAFIKEYNRLKQNQDGLWSQNDHHFEAIKAMAYALLHIRYDEKGVFNSSCMSKYEKLCAFYGYGVKKDETPLRNDASIWTTSLNIGVNCARKEMKLRFWENDKLVYTVKF